MAKLNKQDLTLPSEGVTFKNILYKANYIIELDKGNDLINISNCICVFSILSRKDFFTRQYVGAKFYNELTNENVMEEINGYLPERVFCFLDGTFPLSDFITKNDFQPFTG